MADIYRALTRCDVQPSTSIIWCSPLFLKVGMQGALTANETKLLSATERWDHSLYPQPLLLISRSPSEFPRVQISVCTFVGALDLLPFFIDSGTWRAESGLPLRALVSPVPFQRLLNRLKFRTPTGSCAQIAAPPSCPHTAPAQCPLFTAYL